MALFWIPAFAGMTGGWVVRHSGESRNPGGLPLIIEMLRYRALGIRLICVPGAGFLPRSD